MGLIPDRIEVHRCPCMEPSPDGLQDTGRRCQTHWITFGSFSQGCGWSAPEAVEVARALMAFQPALDLVAALVEAYGEDGLAKTHDFDGQKALDLIARLREQVPVKALDRSGMGRGWVPIDEPVEVEMLVYGEPAIGRTRMARMVTCTLCGGQGCELCAGNGFYDSAGP